MDDLGFTYQITKNNLVIIHHHGKVAATLRNKKSAKFIEAENQLSFAEKQQLMARLTGNYKRGNERHGKNRRTDSHT